MSNYYVSKNGSDANSGSLRFPWATIGEGLSNLEDDDFLYVLEGTYVEAFTFTNTLRDDFAVWNKSPKVSAYPSHTVTVTSTTTSESRTLAHYSLSGLAVVQDPANYAGVSLVKVEYQDEAMRPRVGALMYSVGGPDYRFSAPSDLTVPVVTITSPDDGDTFSGTQEIVVTSSDDVAIESMWINLDGKTVCSSYGSTTCTFEWDTTLSLNTYHTIEAFAKDTAGNIGCYYHSVPAPDGPDIRVPYIVVQVENIPSVAINDDPSFEPSITVTSPSGTEKWIPGTDLSLTWSYVAVTGKLNIYLVREGRLHQIFEKVPNTGTIPWTVMGPKTPRCRVRIESVDNPATVGLSEEFDIV